MLLRRDVTQLMAARIDWARWADSSPTAAASAMLRHFAPAAGASAAQRGVSGSLRATIIAAPGGEQHGLVVAFLREKVGKVLGLSPSKLDAERSLTEYGLDSLIAVELMTMLRMELGVELAAVKLLQGISVAGLTALVLEQIGASGAAVTTAVNPVAAIVVEEGLAADRAIEPPQQAPAEMQAVSVLPLVPAPQHTNGTSVYSTLDYARWTTGQRAVRGVVSAVMRTFTKLDVEGLEHLPLTGGCLLAINHVSMADVPVVLSVLPRRTIMFASDHLRNSAFMDWFLHDMGDAIYVRRGEGDTEALANGLAVLRAGGLLGLGPEGTRSHDGSLARGQTGIAYLATQANVPVVPLAAWGQENIASNLKRMRRPPISVRIGAPIHFAEQAPSTTRLREYTDQVMQSIASMLPPEYRGVYSDRVAS